MREVVVITQTGRLLRIEEMEWGSGGYVAVNIHLIVFAAVACHVRSSHKLPTEGIDASPDVRAAFHADLHESVAHRQQLAWRNDLRLGDRRHVDSSRRLPVLYGTEPENSPGGVSSPHSVGIVSITAETI